MSKLLFESNDWTIDAIERTWDAIDNIGRNRYGLSYYKPRLEIITYEHMLNVYSSVGLPNLYNHWSFGKSFAKDFENYKTGRSGLAYEVVINTDPLVTYLMENNTMTMQTLVMAHAVCGHGSFFKNNYMFEDTHPDRILHQLLEGARYIRECEQNYGVDAVEKLLDACHAIKYYSIDKYPRKQHTQKALLSRSKKRQELKDKNFDEILARADNLRKKSGPREVPQISEENLLLYIEKHAMKLKKWERQVIRIFREIQQYLYPQMHTSVMNEGWASFWHHRIMNDLYDDGLISASSIIEFIQSHSGVVHQPDFDSPWYSGINVYALGFAMFRDIKRMCEEPDDEDRAFAPSICGTDWLATFKHICECYKDDSFIMQFLSPKVIRQLKLFTINNAGQYAKAYTVEGIHNDDGYEKVRRDLAAQYSLSYSLPDVAVVGKDMRGDRELVLKYYPVNGQTLATHISAKVVKQIHTLWRYPVELRISEGESPMVYRVDK